MPFQTYLSTHSSKQYTGPELSDRAQIYASRVKEIDEHNSGRWGSMYSKGTNEFTDWTSDERKVTPFWPTQIRRIDCPLKHTLCT